MKTRLNILHLEDDVRDAELVWETLAAEGIACDATRVETKADFKASIDRGGFDLILADHTLPSFDGMSALKIARQTLPDVPFIFVSGTLGEEVAIEALKFGATDYVFKTRLSRIVPSVQRALREAEERTELSRYGEALCRSEAYLAEAQKLSRTGSFGWDICTGDLYWSRETFRIFEYEPQSKATLEMVKQRTHPEDLAAVREFIERAVREKKEFDFEHRLMTPNGSVKFVRVVGRPAISESGACEFVGAISDITEHKRSESLLAGEKRLLEMVAGGHSMLQVLEMLCRLVESTQSGCRCSVVLLDPSGTHLEQCAAPSLPATFINSILGRRVNAESGPCAMAAQRGQQVFSGDLLSETRWPAHEWRPMALAHGVRACWATPISSMSGKVFGAFAIYYDQPRTPTPVDQNLIERFTHIASIAIETAQNESALKRSESFLAYAQRLSSTGSLCWRVASDELTCSEEIYRIFQLEPGAPVTLERISSRVHPEDLSRWREMVERRQRDPGDYQYEYRLQMPDHSVKYLRVVAHASRAPDGQPEYIAAIQDVTEYRLSEEALGKARSDLAHVARITSLSALTASIAHEINQPLAGIVTNASTSLRMLAADPPNVDGASETARRTIRDANRASDVITRLRTLFTTRTSATELVDLNDAAREVIALSVSDLQRNRVVVRTELADDLPPVTGDRVQLQQVIMNLIRNASEAMSGVSDRPRQLVIRTAHDQGDRVRLTVRDSGVGFGPQGADQLFQPFFTTKPDGMGIGLSLSRSIIESHDGRLWAAPNEGPGATFSFSIPCKHRDESDAGRIGVMVMPVANAAERIMGNPR